jgi:hypothetical protein
VLDPLLKIIAVEYIDHDSLTSSMTELFRFLLTSVEAQDELTCDDMIKGISKIDLGDGQQGTSTRMHLTKMDYDTITQQGALAKGNGALGAAEFDMVMRKQVHDYIKRKLQRSVSETETLKDFASAASLKALMMEVDAIKKILSEMRSEVKASFSDLDHNIASRYGVAFGVCGGHGGGGSVGRGSGGSVGREPTMDSPLRLLETAMDWSQGSFRLKGKSCHTVDAELKALFEQHGLAAVGLDVCGEFGVTCLDDLQNHVKAQDVEDLPKYIKDKLKPAHKSKLKALIEGQLPKAGNGTPQDVLSAFVSNNNTSSSSSASVAPTCFKDVHVKDTGVCSTDVTGVVSNETIVLAVNEPRTVINKTCIELNTTPGLPVTLPFRGEWLQSPPPSSLLSARRRSETRKQENKEWPTPKKEEPTPKKEEPTKEEVGVRERNSTRGGGRTGEAKETRRPTEKGGPRLL